MAELILTDDERAAKLWSDLDDAALGKVVKKKIAHLTGVAEQLDQITVSAAAILLCFAAIEQHASVVTIELDGLTQAGREFGNWKVVVMQTATA